MPQISVTTSSIVARALSLADIVNSKFISYDDKMNSLNEAWKDIYNFFTERNDDYFMTLTTINMAQAVAGAPLNTNEWLLALPSDFYKLRILDYNYSGSWQPMAKFALDRRNNYGTVMAYRFQGQNLWVVGGPFTSAIPQIRIGYYPPPTALYAPNETQFFTVNTGLGDASLASIVDPFYLPGSYQSSLPLGTSQAVGSANGMLYSVPGIGVYYVSNNTNTNTLVVSSATNITLPKYYKGYLYYLQSGDVFSMPFDPKAPVAGTVTSVTGSMLAVQWYDIGVTPNTAYCVTSSDIRTAPVAGGTDWGAGTPITTPLSPPAGITSYGLVQGIQFWVTATGDLQVNNAIVASSVTRAFSDGVYLYYLSGTTLSRGTYASGVMTSELLATDIKSIGNVYQDYIGAVQSEGLNLIAVSDVPDYAITYPNNLVPEMISYQLAMDFKRKQESKEGLEVLMLRFKELQDRFVNDVIMRDDYKPERINNASPRGLNLPGLPGGF